MIENQIQIAPSDLKTQGNRTRYRLEILKRIVAQRRGNQNNFACKTSSSTQCTVLPYYIYLS